MSSGEVAVNFLAVKAANESHRAALENEANAIIPDAETIVLAAGLKSLEVGNLQKGSGGLNLLDNFSDAQKELTVGDSGQVGVEGFAEGRVHAGRGSLRKIFLRVVSRDFSPS